MSRRAFAALFVVSLSMSLSSAARAEGAEKGPPGYTDAVSAALSELEAHNYPEAREEFRRAHALFPNARTLRGLGMVEFELRNYGESVRQLEEALASSVKPLEGKMRSETEALAARARRYLGEVHVETDPHPATVIVDGTSMELGSGGGILLEVGEHTLEVQAPGRASEKRLINVKGGESTSLRISLGPAESRSAATEVAKPAVDLGQPAPTERQPAYKKWWVWTTVAVVIAAGAATTAAVLITRDRETKTSGVEGPNTPGVTLQTLGRF